MDFRKVMTTVALTTTALGVAVSPADARSHLSESRAKSVARDRASFFDYRVESTSVDWFSRWSSREIHVGVTGSWTTTTYHSGCADGYYSGCSADGYTEHNDGECDATVVVRINRYGHIVSQVTDKSCIY